MIYELISDILRRVLVVSAFFASWQTSVCGCDIKFQKAECQPFIKGFATLYVHLKDI